MVYVECKNGVCVCEKVWVQGKESLAIAANMKFQWEAYVATTWGRQIVDMKGWGYRNTQQFQMWAPSYRGSQFQIVGIILHLVCLHMGHSMWYVWVKNPRYFVFVFFKEELIYLMIVSDSSRQL